MGTQGRRRSDVRFGDLPDDLRPGDYWRYTVGEGSAERPASAKAMYGDRAAGNLTDGVWGYYSPDGNGIGTLAAHTVREHDDGTISIRPGDGSSNSVLHSGGREGKTWHGYVDHGVWNEC
jgi:hypothetical protein